MIGNTWIFEPVVSFDDVVLVPILDHWVYIIQTSFVNNANLIIRYRHVTRHDYRKTNKRLQGIGYHLLDDIEKAMHLSRQSMGDNGN